MVVLDTLTALIKGGGKRESDVFRSQYAEVSVSARSRKTFIRRLSWSTTRAKAWQIALLSPWRARAHCRTVDTLWCLKRKPEGEATLEVIGREAEEKTFALKFDQDPFGWRVLGDDAAQLLNTERGKSWNCCAKRGTQSGADCRRVGEVAAGSPATPETDAGRRSSAKTGL